MSWTKINNKYNKDKVVEACSLFGMMNLKGERFSSRDPVRAIENMHDRGNGLGGGFAIYGLYPDYKEYYALHIMYMDADARRQTESFLKETFDVHVDEEIPTREANVQNPPILRRYFVKPRKNHLEGLDPDDYVRENVMKINTQTGKAFVFSSGKDMGVFKGVGYPEDVAQFFCLEEYEGYLWTCHGRFPTNTPGWWGGAHPFNILDWTVVHNGEVSSYGTNRRYLEMYGYNCTLMTDTEVITYIIDLLVRKHGIPLTEAVGIMAAPFWREIELMDEENRRKFEAIRSVYGSALINGPFSIILGFEGGMMALNDRIKLRPLIAAEKGDYVYVASEEAAIRIVCPSPDRIWSPRGGEPVFGFVEGCKWA